MSVQTFEQILAGSLPTDDDGAAVEAVFQALAAHPTPENNDLLLRALVAPDELRRIGRKGPWTARDLRARAFALIKAGASIELRAKLADALGDRVLRLAKGDPIREFLLAADPLNCGAQIVLYQKGDPNREIRTRLEQQLTAYSVSILTRVLAMPSNGSIRSANYNLSALASPTSYGGGVARGGAGKYDDSNATSTPIYSPAPTYNAAVTPGNVDTSAMAQVAGVLWSENFRDTVQSELGKLPPLDKQAQLYVLASTIPWDSTRSVLARALRKRWNDGPIALEAAGLGDAMITDPGLVVILKCNPRRQIKASTSGLSPRATRSGRTSPVGGRGSEPGLTYAQKKEQAELDWMTLSSKLVAAWCARFRASAQAKERAAAERGANLTADEKPELPSDLTLPEDTKVLSSYHLALPAQTPADLGGQKPGGLDVYYIRAEESSKPKRAMGYYARQFQIKTTDMRTTADNKAIWLDGVRMVPQSDQRRSVDVIISSNDNQAADISKETETIDLIVEILTIQISDPRD